jgi:hypothetical protein
VTEKYIITTDIYQIDVYSQTAATYVGYVDVSLLYKWIQHVM